MWTRRGLYLFVRNFYSLKCVQCLKSAQSKRVCMISLPFFGYFTSKNETKSLLSANLIHDKLRNGDFEDVINLLESSEGHLFSDCEFNCLLSYAYWKWAVTSEDESDFFVPTKSADTELSLLSFSAKIDKSFFYALRAYECNSGSADANKMMGLTLTATSEGFISRRRNLSSIIAYLEAAVELDPSDWESHHYLGAHYLETIRFEGPIMMAVDRFFFGVPYRTYDDALEHLLRAEELSPACSCYNLAKIAAVYYKKSKYELAKHYIEKAVNFKCRNRRDEREKEEAAKVLIEWARYTNYFKTVQIR